MITYDLRTPGQEYKPLYDAIKKVGTWWHYLESSWLVSSALDPEAIFKRLKPHIDDNDRILIIRVTRPCQGWLPDEAWQWINKYLKVYVS